MRILFQKSGRLFFLGFVLIFSILFVLVLLFSREVTHETINSFHTPFLDTLMLYWTYLGDGVVLIILLLGLLLISLRHFLSAVAAYAFGGLGAQLLKHLFFSDFFRPVKYFRINNIDYDLYLVPGLDMHSNFSFPSGHTATAFAVFFALALLSKQKLSEIMLFILALGVAYSRVYLSQHFLMDAVGGAFLGMVAGWLAWKWMMRYKKMWLDRSLLDILKS